MCERECCYACGAEPGGYRRPIGDHWAIVVCPTCGLEYTLPRPTDAEVDEYYMDYQDVRADPQIVELNARDHLAFLSSYGWTPESPTLDFGAGPGVFVHEAGENCWGVELGAPDVPRVVHGLDEVRGPFEFVTMWGVLEHLREPVAVMRELAGLLIPRGYLALTTVNAEGDIPYHYKPPEHLSYWTAGAFDALAGRTGFEMVEHQPYVMRQLGVVYLERLLARTPLEYAERICTPESLPEVVEVPTNEVRVVMRRSAGCADQSTSGNREDGDRRWG